MGRPHRQSAVCMASHRHTIGALGAPAKLALGALVGTVAGGGVYFLSTYEVPGRRKPLPKRVSHAPLLKFSRFLGCYHPAVCFGIRRS